tara:strand:- start:10421 stop:10711 length:291 start_codon:yes stop_codon:yes gene_type:complete
MSLEEYLDENLDAVMEDMENIISEVIPEVVQSYNWQDDEEEGFETSEYEWYDSYRHTTGYQAEYEAAECWLNNSEFESSEDNQELLLDKCSIRHSY